jgi:hypothetical protein
MAASTVVRRIVSCVELVENVVDGLCGQTHGLISSCEYLFRDTKMFRHERAA